MSDYNMRRVAKAEKALFDKLCKRTNADRIRAMTDEELANFIVHRDCCPGFVANTFSDANRKKYGFDGRSERCECGDECQECWIDWLRKEAE